MNSVFERLASIIRWPMDRVFSENGYIGSLWHESGRSRSLLLGLPSVLFAVVGLLLLLFAQFGMVSKLEGQYKTRLAESSEQREKLAKELDRVYKMKLSSQVSKEKTTLDDLIPRDDKLRVDLERARKEQRVYLEKLTALSPEDQDYRFQLAKATMGRLGSAENEIGLAMMRRIAPVYEPGYLPAHLFLANWHALMVRRDAIRARKHYDSMKEHLKLILKRDPKHEDALRRLGIIYFDERAYRQAYDLFFVLYENDPRQFKMVTEINIRLNRPQENVAILRVVADHLERKLNEVDRDSDDRTRLLLEVAECYRMQDRRDDAEKLLLEEIKAYSQSKEYGSRLLWAKKLLASNYVSWSGKFAGRDYDNVKNRLAFLRKAFTYNPKNAECLRMLARLGHSEFEDIAKEAQSIYNAYEHYEAPGLVVNELGIVALGEGDHDKALQFFKRAAILEPRNPEILNNLAYTYLKSSQPDPKTALATINRAIKLTPDSKAKLYRSNFFDTRARAYMQLEQYTPAIADLTRAWKDRPDNVAILEAIIYCHEQNDMVESISIWQNRLDEARAKANAPAQQPAAENANSGQPGIPQSSQ